MKKTAAMIIAAVAACAVNADIYMAGDSTMCNYRLRDWPKQGWGQALGWFMKEPSKLHNCAVGGMSLRTCRAGRWQSQVVDKLKPGDYVIIAFGHNDCIPQKADRYSTPEDFIKMMEECNSEVTAKGAKMIICTSIPHSGGFSEDAEKKMHVRGGAAKIGSHVWAACEAAKKIGIPCLNLNRYAEEHLPELGLEKAFKLYMRIAPGEYGKFPGGFHDACHLRDTGAFWFAKAAVTLATEQKLPICTEYFKNTKDVTFKPFGFDGPDKGAKESKDDFSMMEIGYANEEELQKIDDANAWRHEIMALRKEAQRNGMSKDEASRWAAAEYRRRQAERAAKNP